MKTIRLKDRRIVRLSNSIAAATVRAGFGDYVAKSEWKKTRDKDKKGKVDGKEEKG